ncbi:MerR family transcriptional regulator [Mucilaginibacter roseus]|uniref:MerR family transcriptional regulator n=1 Tax=Mucilaginibacter roseus TaxID=1528868 RepID=A0ABS8TVW5_9SPHI|nr:MerR family transcriptional regulator [Mucilaginibacter roseus]MCD8739018.1 MerR family transcriptional regulator [Mucilaginibacter roseus]
MLINQLAKRTGVTVHTLRYYENLALIQGKVNPELKSNNYKYYDEEVVERVTIIKDVQGLGFTLAEIKKMFHDYYSREVSIEERVNILSDKIKEVDDKIKHFHDMRSRLVSIRTNIENGLGCKPEA